MSFLAWIVVGIIAGIVAKAIMPGWRSEPNSFIGTMLLGIFGAVVGGWLWNAFFNAPGATGINLGSLLVSIVGSIVLIGIGRLLQRAA